MSLLLIVDLCLRNLNKLLKLGDLELEKVDRILSGGLLSLKGSGEFEGGLKLRGKGFETVDDVLRDLGSGLRSMVIVVLELRQRWFGGSRSTNLAAGPTAVLVFRGGFFILFIYPLQLVGDDGRNTAGVVVVIREFVVVKLFPSLGVPFTLFHKLLDQFNVLLEAAVLSDE
jgi:hypothetical protein